MAERFGQIDVRLDGLTGIVVDLAKDVGEVKGLLGIPIPIEAPLQSGLT